MKYIAFPYANSLPGRPARRRVIVEYTDWLEKNVGERGKGWEWLRGDLIARGVYIDDDDHALAFTLRFKI